jgi:hypothetical protein
MRKSICVMKMIGAILIPKMSGCKFLFLHTFNLHGHGQLQCIAQGSRKLKVRFRGRKPDVPIPPWFGNSGSGHTPLFHHMLGRTSFPKKITELVPSGRWEQP